ncbi:MAG: MFS transporter, partial [Luteimonas sp.]|nr:MFS transporter [Luteimonas sp.]
MQATSMTPAQRLRSIFSGSVGNLVEWYDWYVYAAFSLYFAEVFFPGGDRTSQLLKTAAIFAVGFLMRPLGAWLLGRYADRHGRKRALMLSVVMMCTGSLMIACTPGYASIGVAAPILLVLARLLQGLSVGGEYGTSATYLSEVATRAHRGFWSSFQYVTLVMGHLVALGVLIALQRVFLSDGQLRDWGWRIPFVIGAIAAVVALWLRRTMVESESFARSEAVAGAAANARQGTLRELARHPRAVLTVIGLTMGGTLAFYTYTTYVHKFMVNSAGIASETASLINASTLFVYMLLQPLVGALSDRIGRRRILIAFGVLGTLCTWPILSSLQGATPVQAFWLILAALVIVSGYTAINAVVKAELFPVEVRALGVGLPYALTVALFGGTAEYVALWFKDIGHETGFFWYVSACIGVSLLVYLKMP